MTTRSQKKAQASGAASIPAREASELRFDLFSESGSLGEEQEQSARSLLAVQRNRGDESRLRRGTGRAGRETRTGPGFQVI